MISFINKMCQAMMTCGVVALSAVALTFIVVWGVVVILIVFFSDVD